MLNYSENDVLIYRSDSQGHIIMLFLELKKANLLYNPSRM